MVGVLSTVVDGLVLRTTLFFFDPMLCPQLEACEAVHIIVICAFDSGETCCLPDDVRRHKSRVIGEVELRAEVAGDAILVVASLTHQHP